MKRSAGVLLPVTSLPSPYGVGTLGKAAFQFVDFLVKAGQTYWQVLPLGPTGYGDSPYQSFSAYAGNPYMIDLDLLAEDGYLRKKEYRREDWGNNPEKIDYGLLYEKKFPVLKIAADRLIAAMPEDFVRFMDEEAFWLDDYASFMALKGSLGNIALNQWPEKLRERKKKELKKALEPLQQEVLRWKALQYFFFTQWQALKEYANEQGILIIGDIPVYVAADSADVWAQPEQFQLDGEGKLLEVAGVPPDAFTADGQLWGNPLYNWNRMKREGYRWWKQRIAQQLRFYDVLRIDHFRGFESYYAVPGDAADARSGIWRKGPGIGFFREIEKELGQINIIAEDLGFLTEEVRDMVRETGYPGMKVLQFAFNANDPSNEYLPHMYKDHNCVVYTGTHDNDTIMGWMESAGPEAVNKAVAYLKLDKKEGYGWGMMRGAWSSTADTAVVTMQDLLGLGTEARLNYPSTTGTNWTWRCLPGKFTASLARKLYSLMELYDRLG